VHAGDPGESLFQCTTGCPTACGVVQRGRRHVHVVRRRGGLLQPELIRALPELRSLLVETAAYTGLRAGELAGLKVERLDLKRRQLRVTRTVVDVKGELLEDTPKTEAGHRTVTGLSTALCARLEGYVAAHGLGPPGPSLLG
jgi:integrase